jgi:hypothetical protein
LVDGIRRDIVQVGGAKGDVAEQGVVEEDAGLLDQGDILAQPVEVEGGDGVAIDGDASGPGLVEAHEEVAQGALSGAAFANDEGELAGLKPQSGGLEDDIGWV